MDRENRVVVLIDMDCFYCQVEEKLNPELKGKPIAVVQYNPWKGGGIIAVNYVARDRGVTRHMRGDEAKEKCPEIQLPSVPCQRGKADISKYRDAGKEVAKVLQKYTSLLERASIDEAYLDITESVNERLRSTDINSITAEAMPNTFALGYSDVTEFVSEVHNCCSENIDFDYENAQRLLVGAVIVSEIRAAVYNETGYRCSAGISHNKILAKLVCGLHKPDRQTVLPRHAVHTLYTTLSVKKVKHLGGKFGELLCATLGISKMAELRPFSERELQSRFDEKNGTWLYNIARGVDLEPVQARFNPKSIGCCKQFKGKAALLDLESLTKWLRDLGAEIEDRLDKDALENNRNPKQMVVSYSTQVAEGRDVSSSRSHNLVDEELSGETFWRRALELVLEGVEGCRPRDGEPNRKLQMPIKFLGISVGKFEDITESKKTRKINDFFSAGPSKFVAFDKSNNNNASVVETSTGDKDTNKEVKANLNTKSPPDKAYVMKKFFQITDRIKEKEPQHAEAVTDAVSKILEWSGETQESFFAQMLQHPSNQKILQSDQNSRPTTLACKVAVCGEDSRDSDYSSSTINEEINKSISLFEDDPNEVERVSNMRSLLNTKRIEKETAQGDKENNSRMKEVPVAPPPPVTFECPDCKKTIPLAMFDTHADFHLALKIREEERQRMRDERAKIDSPLKLPKATKEAKKEPTTTSKSIADFFVKVDETVQTETCPECSKRVAVDKLEEHKDFHEAKKLSRELNKPTGASSVKRKRGAVSPENKPKMMCKPISSFFRS